jgi:hypothetical protein
MSYDMRAEFVSGKQSLEFNIKTPCDLKKGEILNCFLTIDVPHGDDAKLVTRGKTYRVTIE